MDEIKQIQTEVRKLNVVINKQVKQRNVKGALENITKAKKMLARLKHIVETSPDEYFQNYVAQIGSVIGITATIGIIALRNISKSNKEHDSAISNAKQSLQHDNESRKNRMRERKELESKRDNEQQRISGLESERKESGRKLTSLKQELDKKKKEYDDKDLNYRMYRRQNSYTDEDIEEYKDMYKNASPKKREFYDLQSHLFKTIRFIDELVADKKKIADEIKEIERDMQNEFTNSKRIHDDIELTNRTIHQYDNHIRTNKKLQQKRVDDIANDIKTIRSFQNHKKEAKGKIIKRSIRDTGVLSAAVVAMIRKNKKKLINRINKQIANLTKVASKLASIQ